MEEEGGREEEEEGGREEIGSVSSESTLRSEPRGEQGCPKTLTVVKEFSL